MIKVCRYKDIVSIASDADETLLRSFADGATSRLFADLSCGAAFALGKGQTGVLGAFLAAACAERGIKTAVFAEENLPEKAIKPLVGSKTEVKNLSDFTCSSVVIDCLSPDKFTKKPGRELVSVAKKINECRDCVKISVLSPFGLNPDSGESTGFAVAADKTLCFSAAASGLILSDGLNYSGEPIVIGDCPVRILGSITDENFAALPKRKRVSHKGVYGKISVIGGSDAMPGAPLMAYGSAVAASVSGAGLVRLCVGENEKCAYKSRVTEQTLFFLPEKDGFIRFDQSKLREIIEYSDVIALGPGMGNNPFLPEIIEFLCQNFNKTLILDADALNAVAKNPDSIKNHVAKPVLTPHIGEFARLAPEIKPFDIKKVKAFARKNKCVLVLKSACTVITDGVSVFFNTSGTPALAKGGSGDVLSGIIAAYSAVCSPLEAAAKACYRFGKTAERVARITGEEALLARDVIAAIQGEK